MKPLLSKNNEDGFLLNNETDKKVVKQEDGFNLIHTVFFQNKMENVVLNRTAIGADGFEGCK